MNRPSCYDAVGNNQGGHMCRYSHDAQNKRDAVQGETLVLRTNDSGSVGFYAEHDDHCETAVCIPHGSELLILNIPQEIADTHGLMTTENARLVDIVPEEASFGYSDGLAFVAENGGDLVTLYLQDFQQCYGDRHRTQGFILNIAPSGSQEDKEQTRASMRVAEIAFA